MKTKPTTDNEHTTNAPPTNEQLAALAVASQRKNPADAVQYALAVWREARAALRVAADAQARLKIADVPLPKKFPAPLADFLRLVVGGKTQGDGIALLRRFYREETRHWFASNPSLLNRPISAKEILIQGGKSFLAEGRSVIEGGKVAFKEGMTPQDDDAEIEARAVNEITAWKQHGFKTAEQWIRLARRFSQWRTQDKSRSARESALKRGVTKKSR